MTRRRRVLLSGGAAAAMLTGLLPAYGPLGASAAGCAHVRTHNGWSTIDAPTFPLGPSNVAGGSRLFAEANGELYLTDGRTVMRSRTGGCSWQQVFTLQALDYDTSVADDAAKADPENLIQSMVVLPSPKGRAANTIYLAMADAVSTFTFLVGTPVYVFVSHDDGATWSHAIVPLVAPGTDNLSGSGVGSSSAVRALASVASPNHSYIITSPVVFGALVDPYSAHQEVSSVPAMASPLFGLFTSTDSGTTWRHPAPSGLPSGDSSFNNTAMVANQAVDGTLYLATQAVGSTLGNVFSLWRSTDSGLTWRRFANVPGATWMSSGRLSAQGRTILFSTGTTAYLSVDGGRKWTMIPEPVVVGGGWSLTYGNSFLAGPHHTLVDVLEFNSSWTGTKPIKIWQTYDPTRHSWTRVSLPVVDSGLPKSKLQQPDSYSYGAWADAPGGAVIDLLVYANNVQYVLRHTGPMK